MPTDYTSLRSQILVMLVQRHGDLELYIWWYWRKAGHKGLLSDCRVL